MKKKKEEKKKGGGKGKRERWKGVSAKAEKEERVAAKRQGWEMKKPGAGLGFA